MTPADVATPAASVLTHHRVMEAYKFAYGKRTELGDDLFNNNTENAKNMTSRAFGDSIRKLIDDNNTSNMSFYQPSFKQNEDHGTTHLNIIDADGNAVATTSTINTSFGSK